MSATACNSHAKEKKQKNEATRRRSADLEGRERPAVGVDRRIESQVLGAEAAPEGFVGDGVAEARAGAGEHRGGARAGLGDDRVEDESLHALQTRRGGRRGLRWQRRR